MTVLHTVFAFALLAAEPAEADATTYTLKETVKVGGQTKNKLHLVIRGKIKAGDNEEAVNGQVLLEYAEKTLELGEDQLGKKVLRHYGDARAKFVVGQREDPRQVRVEVRYQVGERDGEHFTLWSPGGPLNSDERELVEDVLDTTRLPGLLPKEPVKVGGKWKPEPNIVQSLCDFDKFIDSNVECVLEKVDQGSGIL